MKNPYKTKRRGFICNADFEPPPLYYSKDFTPRQGGKFRHPGSLLKSATGANKRGRDVKDNG